MPAGKPAKNNVTPKTAVKTPLHGKTDWFTHDRFGMFIHWGLYALPARQEWIKQKERISDEDYRKYFEHFDPDLYDPKQWARTARETGMKYFVITTKHHEGFCLWDTKYTDYKITNTPCGKDLLKPMVKAFRDEGLKVGFYHSLIDWHHPEFPVDKLHPMYEDKAFRKAGAGRDVRKYARYLHNQVRELLSGFGKIDYIFFDFSYPGDDGKGRDDWNSKDLIKLCRRLQPDILINDRLDMLDVPGGWDLRTPEQFMMRQPYMIDGKEVPWETCQTFSGSWGYHREESTWKSVKQLLYLLIDTVGKNGNLLLNVGPTARGTFDERAEARMAGIGKWMKHHSRSIYGCGAAPADMRCPEDCRLTYNPKTRRLYVHVLNWPIKHLHLDGFAGRIKYAQLLNDASEVKIHETSLPDSWWGSGEDKSKKTAILELPTVKPDTDVVVIELFMK